MIAARLATLVIAALGLLAGCGPLPHPLAQRSTSEEGREEFAAFFVVVAASKKGPVAWGTTGLLVMPAAGKGMLSSEVLGVWEATSPCWVLRPVPQAVGEP